jgi:hypothetical protein
MKHKIEDFNIGDEVFYKNYGSFKIEKGIVIGKGEECLSIDFGSPDKENFIWKEPYLVYKSLEEGVNNLIDARLSSIHYYLDEIEDCRTDIIALREQLKEEAA